MRLFHGNHLINCHDNCRVRIKTVSSLLIVDINYIAKHILPEVTKMIFITRCVNVDLNKIDLEVNLKESNVQSKTCKIEPKIPFYLIVAGILNIVLMVVRIIFQVSSKKVKQNGNGWSMIIVIYTFASLFHPMHFFRDVAKNVRITTATMLHVPLADFLLISPVSIFMIWLH